MSGYILGIDPSQVDSSATFKLGSLGTDDEGRVWEYVEFDEATDAYEAAIIHEDFGAEPIETTESAAGTGQGKPVGVPIVDFTAGQFGWVCRYGTGSDIKVFVAASCVKYTELNTTATDGTLDDNASGAEVVAGIVVTTTATASKQTEQAVLNWPYVGRVLV